VHLVNGHLSHASSSQPSQPAAWADYFNNTQFSSSSRPWMPALGNHENEPAASSLGYLPGQTRFTLPASHSKDDKGRLAAD
jgi:hypothetical protein